MQHLIAPVIVFVVLLHAAAPELIADERAKVVVTDSEGRVNSGLLTDLRAGQLTLKGSEQLRLMSKNLISLKFSNRSSIFAATGPLLVLAGGDIVALIPDRIDAEWLTARWAHFPAWPAVKIPIEMVRALLLNRPAGAAGAASLFGQVLDYRESQDLVILINGDTFAGELAALDEKQLHLKTPQGKSAIERSGIEAVILNPALASSEALKGEGALVSLTDGSRLRAFEMKLIALERLTMRTLFGAELSIPLSAVESLRFLGGSAVYLSDLTPVEYKFEPYLALDWPLRVDHNVTGGLLKLRGVEFPKGLGVHSKSSVTYRLDGKFRRFRAVIGIDDDAAGAGSAEFEVLLDGKSIYRSGVLTGTSPAAAIERLDVSGARLMTLRVDYATLADIQDHADWCEAVLIK
jgi:hypothetical protein